MDKTVKAEGRSIDSASPREAQGVAKPASRARAKPPAATRPSASRLSVEKTYKLYINGKFPRTESGRYFTVADAKGNIAANMCRASRKDFREAVLAARAAFNGWAGASAYLRGQILYRVAEMLEARAEQFVAELKLMGVDKRAATREVTATIDCLVYYAGWTDKYQQVFSAVNPVASSHFNFSILEPVGVVSVLSGNDSALLGFVEAIAPVIAGGNTAIALASEQNPLCAVSFAEVLHSSDVPAGVINILSGYRNELAEQFASHMDVNAIIANGDDASEIKMIQEQAANNIKRVIIRKKSVAPDPYQIIDVQETKTTWHPIGG
jgi:acyl-CoA reductase-like NAD-dependent aldehyde dehydrogenase